MISQFTDQILSANEYISVNSTAIVKQKSNLQIGDFIIYYHQKVPCNLPQKISGVINNAIDYVLTVMDRSIIVNLHRPQALKYVIEKAFHSQKTSNVEEKNKLLLHFKRGPSNHEANSTDLDTLRGAILTQHLVRLLQTEQYEVDLSITTADFLDYVTSHKYYSKETPLPNKTIRNDTSEMWHQLRKSKYCERLCDATEIATEGDPNASRLDLEEKYTICLQKYCTENDICIGKQGYDKNIHSIKDATESTTDDYLTELAELQQHSDPKVDICLHVCSQRQSFVQQQTDLLWQLYRNVTAQPCFIPQVHSVYGSVRIRSENGELLQSYTAHKLYCNRRAMVSESVCLKYGDDVVQGSEWKNTIDALTAAELTFELLSTSINSEVKLKVLTEADNISECKGIFVMYNCARLSALFKQFDQCVANGKYPPLPPLEDIDYTKLKEKDEWILLFNYVLPFHDIVTKTTEALRNPKGPNVKLNTHTICHFLLDLSRDLSSYYGRVHILTDPLPHLHSTMFARLYLLKTVQQTMHHALNLLNIQPIHQL